MSYDLTDNKREDVILEIIDILEDIEGIVTVKRNIPSLKEYLSMPESICPYIGVCAGLPVPMDYELMRCSGDYIACQMDIEIWFFGFDNSTPDSGISFWYQELWRALYSKPTLNEVIEGMQIYPKSEVNIVTPNYAFLTEIKTVFVLPTGG